MRTREHSTPFVLVTCAVLALSIAPAYAFKAETANDPECAEKAAADIRVPPPLSEATPAVTAVNQPPVTQTPADPPSCTDRRSAKHRRALIRLLAELARAAAQ
ncbi:MAG TPA: hypothetical protein VF215_07430 [Thermoanaerobaculia bacterium]